eukprot:scaffold6898_cov149-Amphora_coffeaeformis.AAC.5
MADGLWRPSWTTASAALAAVGEDDDPLTTAALRGLQAFLAWVAAISLWHARVLFYDSHGWRHRLAGACLLVYLIVGSCGCSPTTTTTTTTNNTNPGSSTILHDSSSSNDFYYYYYYYLTYDVVLGLLGLTATLTAARDFPHRYVQNAPGQSGTLSVQAMSEGRGTAATKTRYSNSNLSTCLGPLARHGSLVDPTSISRSFVQRQLDENAS